MLISSSTGNLIYNGQTAVKNFPLFKKAGFNAVDLSLDAILNQNSGGFYNMKRSELFDRNSKNLLAYFKEIKDAAEANGIIFGQTHAPFPSRIVGGDEAFNDYIVSVIKKSIEITGYLNCPYIVIHPVFGKYDKWLDKEEEYKINIEFYAQFIPLLKKCGVKACLENMWVSNKDKIYAAACTDFDEVVKYIDELNGIAGEELFGFCLDTGHVTLTSGNMRYAIRTLGKKIKVLHLHDVDGVKDSHTLPFLGVSDWDLILRELVGVGYEGTLNFEALKWWNNFPKELYFDALCLLSSVGNYFKEKYFNSK